MASRSLPRALSGLALYFLFGFISGEDNLDVCKPQQVHISYGDDTTEMVIMWATESDCFPTVHFSTDPWDFKQKAPGESRMFEDPANKNGLQVLHRVKLRDLVPETTYYYKPESGGSWVGPYFFKTPSNESDVTETEMLFISDLNTSSDARKTIIELAEEGKYSALLHGGNIAMNMSTGFGKNGDRYFTLMEQAFRSLPYMVSPGPGEIEDGSYTHYLHRFSMPKTRWPIDKDIMWYSVDIGPVHVISYSTDVFYTNNGEYKGFEHDWLVKDLKKANKNRVNVPWVVAFGHEPMYCSYDDPKLACNKKTSTIKAELEDIFYHYGVDIILQSNGGPYERSYPMYKGVSVTDNYTNPLGPVHVVSGGASEWKMEYNFTAEKPKWCSFRYTDGAVPSYGRLRIKSSQIAEWEQVSFEDKTVIDSFFINQSKHGQFSTDKLSPNITAKIDKEIVDAGGKPGVLNIDEIGTHTSDTNSRIEELLRGDNRNRLIIGISGGVLILVALTTIIVCRRCRKRRRTTRRWEQMDIDYGKKFYSKAPEKDEDNDFEIDMSDGTEPNRRLLNSED